MADRATVAPDGHTEIATLAFEALTPEAYRVTIPDAAVVLVADGHRTLFADAHDRTHEYVVSENALSLLADPSMLAAFGVSGTWLEGDLVCAEVDSPPTPVSAVTEVCLRRIPPLTGMIERVTVSGSDRAWTYQVRPESVRERRTLDTAAFDMGPPGDSIDMSEPSQLLWIDVAARAPN